MIIPVQQALPESTVVVIDDGSDDNTYEKAKGELVLFSEDKLKNNEK